MTDTGAKDAARERAKAKYAFYTHLVVFIAVNILLTVINLLTGSGAFWAIWPVLGWGLAVVIHALNVFALPDRSRIIDRMTEQEMRKRGD